MSLPVENGKTRLHVMKKIQIEIAKANVFVLELIIRIRDLVLMLHKPESL